MKIRLIIILLISNFSLVISNYSFAQVPPQDDEHIQQKIEETDVAAEAELDYSELFDKLDNWSKHPLDLNNATETDLKNLIYINDIQINNLIQYREKYGKLYSVYELEAIDGFYLDVIFKILPYVYVSANAAEHKHTLKDMLKHGDNRFIASYQQTLETQNGYKPINDSALKASPNSRYLGSPQKLSFRYKYNYLEDLSFGFSGFKNAGEQFFKGSEKNGFDFYSAHLFLKNVWKLKSIAIGDFQAQFGQGLTYYSGLTFYGKSTEVLSIKKYGDGLKPSTTSDKSLLLRGIGTTLALNKFEITAFYSQKKIDASVIGYDSITQKNSVVSSASESDLHATSSQVENKNNLTETIIGSHISFKNNGLNIGITAFNVQYNHDIVFTPKPYNQFYFTGTSNTSAGMDYSYSLYNFNIFGEAARSGNNAMAYINGIVFSPDRRILISVLYRNYAVNFHPLFSNGFAENSQDANETGLYTGIQIKVSRNWTVSAYADNFSFPWLKYQTNAPSSGVDYLFKVDYNIINRLETSFLVRYKNKPVDSSEPNPVDFVNNNIIINYRFNISYTVNPALTLRDRVEFLTHYTQNDNTQNGYLMYQDIIYKISKSRLTLTVRYALFDTDTYYERIYASENSASNTYSVPSYYYKGSNYSILLKYKLTKKIDFWLSYSQSYYPDRSTIGTGLDQINGNTKSALMSEIRILF